MKTPSMRSIINCVTTQTLSEKAIQIDGNDFRKVPVELNPSPNRLLGMVTHSRYGVVRAFFDGDVMYAWDAAHDGLYHYVVASKLGVEYDDSGILVARDLETLHQESDWSIPSVTFVDASGAAFLVPENSRTGIEGIRSRFPNATMHTQHDDEEYSDDWEQDANNFFSHSTIRESVGDEYYMSEGCGAFAYAIWVSKGKPEDGRIGIISDVDGEPWSDSYDFEATHVFYHDANGNMDVKGRRSIDSMIADFNINGTANGPYQPEHFRNDWLGDDDNKPLFGNDEMIQEALEYIGNNPELYM